jgi:DNA-directed RNA polymerase subunit F
MVDAKIIEEKPITMAELKEEIEQVKKRDKEVNFRVTQTDDYLSNFKVLSQKNSIEFAKEIAKLEIPRLKEQHITKIVDFLPETVEELKVILEAYPITIVDKNLKRIVDLVKEFREKN